MSFFGAYLESKTAYFEIILDLKLIIHEYAEQRQLPCRLFTDHDPAQPARHLNQHYSLSTIRCLPCLETTPCVSAVLHNSNGLLLQEYKNISAAASPFGFNDSGFCFLHLLLPTATRLLADFLHIANEYARGPRGFKALPSCSDPIHIHLYRSVLVRNI